MLNTLEKHFNLKRWVNILIVYLIFYGTIILFFTIITPKVIESMKNLGKDIPYYASETQNGYQNPGYLKEIDKYGIFDYIKTSIDELFLSWDKA